MADIKSAREIAMEKVARLGSPSAAERQEWKFVPEGERLAAKFMQEGGNLLTDLSRYDEEARKHVIAGARGILVRNLAMPRNDVVKKDNKRAMDGLRNLIQDKVGMENTFSKIRRIFEHYLTQGAQQKKQAYENLKVDFAAKLQQALRQQYGTTTGFKIDVERQPQFLEEWRKLQGQLDAQYSRHLEEYKQELLSLP